MLVEQWPAAVAGRDQWRPYPTAADREAWEHFDADVRKAWIAAADDAMTRDWPELGARAWLAFSRHGDRGPQEGPQFTRRIILRDLVLGACATGDDRYADAIADAVWSTCEETWWGWSAHTGSQRAGAGLPDVDEPIIDLGVGESAAHVAWAHYLAGGLLDLVSPLIRQRIEHEVRHRVVRPFLDRDDFWWMTAVNNWNPWCHSNILVSTLAVEPDPELRSAVVAKVVHGIDRFLADYPADGGCDEGPVYWTRVAGALFTTLEHLHHATGGAIDVFDQPLVAEIARFILRVHVTDDWWVNFADGAARFPLPGPVVHRLGTAVGDPGVAALGAASARSVELGRLTAWDGFTALLPTLFHDDWRTADTDVPLLRDAWLPVIEVLTTRDRADDPSGWFLAAKGGHNDEVHNHNDVGSVTVYLDGRPVLIDAGVGPYSAKTFNEHRYEIWTMQSGWHNVPVVNGFEQPNGRRFAAADVHCEIDDDVAWLRCDIAAAYPAEAGIERWVRTARLTRGVGVDLSEAFAFRADDRTGVALHLLTNRPVVAGVGGGSARLGDDVELLFDDTLDLLVDDHEVQEGNIADVWGPVLHRIRLVGVDVPRVGTFTVRLRRREAS